MILIVVGFCSKCVSLWYNVLEALIFMLNFAFDMLA